MDNFKILNNLEDSIIVLDSKNEIYFQNTAAKKQFGVLTSINKIKKYFNFDICVLNPEEIATITPIDMILVSKENFHTFCTYQKTKEEYIYFNISTERSENFKTIIFNDVTSSIKLESTDKNLKAVSDKYNTLIKEHKKFTQLKDKAQDQALKMSFLNRISTIMRESDDIPSLINSTIVEIQNILGSYKTYFAKKYNKTLKITYITPEKHNGDIGIEVNFEKDVLKAINDKRISITACLKECLNSGTTVSKNTKRIIIPIFHHKKLLGIIATFTTNKNIFYENFDILESISTQLANSIVRISLFEQVNKKNEKLQKTLNELKETQLQLINSEKMASVGQLVAGVAHEINTPLASIHSNNEICKKILGKLSIDDENLLQTMKSINDIDNEAIKRISNIVKSLKKFVRLDESQLQEADINKELDLTLQLISHETKNKITIVRNYSKLPLIMCYVNALNQVFMNILVNACQSIKDKGEIIITTSYKNDNLIVSIKDNGIGMSPKIKEQIFNTGFTTKGIGIGTGLGLAISNKIIQRHKGTITFKSEENVGTEFIITIPAQKNLK